MVCATQCTLYRIGLGVPSPFQSVGLLLLCTSILYLLSSEHPFY